MMRHLMPASSSSRLQRLRRERIELQRRKLDASLWIARAVALEIDHHDVLVGSMMSPISESVARRLLTVASGVVEHRARIVDQHDRAAVGVEPVVEEIARDLHVLAEDVLGRRTGAKPTK